MFKARTPEFYHWPQNYLLDQASDKLNLLCLFSFLLFLRRTYSYISHDPLLNDFFCLLLTFYAANLDTLTSSSLFQKIDMNYFVFTLTVHLTDIQVFVDMSFKFIRDSVANNLRIFASNNNENVSSLSRW